MSDSASFYQTEDLNLIVTKVADGFEFDVESGCCCSGYKVLTQDQAYDLRNFLDEHLQ